MIFPTLGFADAPVTRLVMLGTVLLSLLLPIDVLERIHLDVWQVLTRGELWRLVTHHLVYIGLPEMLLCSLCLFSFRIVERQMGSKKFGAFIAIVLALATPVEAATAVYFPSVRLVPGPLPLVFALFVLYHVCIPTLHPKLLQLVGINFSEKAFTYILGFELIIFDGWNSTIPALSGAVMGILYTADALSMQGVRLPRVVYKCCLIWHRRPAPPRPSRRASMGGIAMLQRLRPQSQAPLLPLRAPPPLPPSESEVATLTSMGFDRRQALHALAQTGNSVQRAADRLLASGQPGADGGGGGEGGGGGGGDGASDGHSHAH